MARTIPADVDRCRASVSLDNTALRELSPEPNPANEGRCRRRGREVGGFCAQHGYGKNTEVHRNAPREGCAVLDGVQAAIDLLDGTELNINNYSHDEVQLLNDRAVDVWRTLTALVKGGPSPERAL